MSSNAEPSAPQVRLESFVGQYDARSAWVIVRVDDSRWTATLPAHDLLTICDGRPAGLQGIDHAVDGDALVVSFGPARVRAGLGAWRALAERLLTSPRSTAELMESPGARPWDGPVAEVPIGALVVAHEPPSLYPTEQVARLAGFDLQRFIEVFGDQWREVRPPRDLTLDRLFVWGEPAQVALAWGHDGLVVGRPDGHWSPGFEDDIADPVPVDPSMLDDDIAALVGTIVRKRRRSFTWCRSCGAHLVPEGRFERTLCYGCAASRHGIIY